MRHWLRLLLLAACWAPSFLFIKIALTGGLPPLAIGAGRVSLAALLLAAVLVARGPGLPRDVATWRRLAPMALLSTAIPFTLFNLGEQHADSSLAAILNGTTPLFTVILAQIFLHDEPLTPRVAFGALIGFAGIVVIAWPDAVRALTAPDGAGVFGRTAGIAMFTAASACYGAANVYARRRLIGLAPLVAPTLQMTLAGALLLAASAAVDAPLALSPTPGALAAIVFLAVFGTAAAYMLYYPLVAETSATFVSLVTYLLPPAGIGLGMLVLGERPGWNDIAGCVLIILGVAAVNRR